MGQINAANAEAGRAANGGASSMQQIWTGAMHRIGEALVDLSAKAVEAVVELGKVGVEYNAQMEQYSTSFRTMLDGNSDAADQMLEDLRKFAADTPLLMEDLAKGAQTLLQFGEGADTVLDTLKMLGDISLGDANRMQSLTLAFAQMSSTGKLMGQDLLQMINAGFNPLKIIAEETGVSIGDLKAIMSDGSLKNVSEETAKIFEKLTDKALAGESLSQWEELTLQIQDSLTVSSDVVRAAFQSATQEGGLFFGAMEAQSQTLNGRLSTLQDNFEQFAGRITSNLTPAIGEIVDVLGDMIEENSLLEQSLTQVFNGVAQVASDALPMLAEVLQAVIPAVSELARDLFPALAGIAESLLPPLQSLAADIFPLISSVLKDIMPVVQTAIDYALPALLSIIDAIKPHLESIAQHIMPAISGILKILVPLLADIGAELAPILDAVFDALEPLAGLFEILEDLMPVIDALAHILLTTLCGAIKEFASVMKTFFTSAIESAKKNLEGWVDFFTGIFTGDMEKAVTGLGKIVSSIFDTVLAGIEGLVNGAISIINGLIDGYNWLAETLGWGTIDHLEYVAWTSAAKEERITTSGTPFSTSGGSDYHPYSGGSFGDTDNPAEYAHSSVLGGAAGAFSAPTSISLTGNVEMDGFKVGTVVLQNIDDAAEYTLRG